MTSPLIETDAVGVDLGGRPILSDISLSFAAGEVVAILGPNGAGKSTLLHVLAGLLPPTAGRVEARGRVAAALQAPALANRSALANVELALSWWGVSSRAERRGRAMRALETIHAEHLAGRSARTLSGGEARRVHLARALALNADVLLLDEPFAGLDPSTRADLLYESATVLRDPNRATVVVVHDRAEARALADRVIVIIDGAVGAEGQPREIFDCPPNETVAAFLGYEGCITAGAQRTRYRPAEVHVDPDGPLRASVRRAIPLEHGVRLELEVPGGVLIAHVAEPGPTLGSDLRVRLDHGAVFDAKGAQPASRPAGVTTDHTPSTPCPALSPGDGSPT